MAAAEAVDAELWHCDRHFELIAEVTGQPVRRLGPEPGSTVLRDREALVRVVRTCGEGVMQAGRLDDPFPARSAPSGWGYPEGEETGPTRTGSGLAGRTGCNAQAR